MEEDLETVVRKLRYYQTDSEKAYSIKSVDTNLSVSSDSSLGGPWQASLDPKQSMKKILTNNDSQDKIVFNQDLWCKYGEYFYWKSY